VAIRLRPARSDRHSKKKESGLIVPARIERDGPPGPFPFELYDQSCPKVI
jgi:hypothetical protein